IADAFADGMKFNHGLTFGGHPVAAAAGIANLEIFLREDLAGRSKTMGAYLRSELEAALGENPIVGDIRGVGLFQGVELVKDRATKETPHDHDSMVWLTDELRRKGILLRVDERVDPTTQFSPPLIITREEIDRMVFELTAGITEVGRRWGKIGTLHA
ncbi:MAG TPA: aminotransferase class III-fold pyridoxal phosphate-dependent enzyme, partial [Bryobacteraceae bacterium]|nr:aminotransferase class III-fold pyridoxal phosphate-dependent enzyme [Bryobacteraceae bacterium]